MERIGLRLATALILVSAFGSVFAAMLGYSRVPYAAALDGNFFSVFARVHPTKRFPHISLLALGGTAFVFCLSFSLIDSIRAILAMRCIIQFIGQAVGLIAVAAALERGEIPFQDVALSFAGGDCDSGMDWNFYFDRAAADAGVAGGDGGGRLDLFWRGRD